LAAGRRLKYSLRQRENTVEWKWGTPGCPIIHGRLCI
jgi:hypothetical protein